MNADYIAGREARSRNLSASECPHPSRPSETGAPVEEREASPMCRRHWWLAGWHDKDIELGYRVSGVAA